jgi:predicted transcriptional regulator
MQTSTLTLRVPPELKKHTSEHEIVASIERGVADMQAGRGVIHREVVADIDANLNEAKASRKGK